VVQALVYTLLDVFDASRDLHQTLRAKEKRDYEHSLRSRGYPSGRKFDYVDDKDARGDESMVLDKAAVTRQFENGCQEVGPHFSVGDGMFNTVQPAVETR
jgi:UTP-glucose-1-phosphate uridylyltransferase